MDIRWHVCKNPIARAIAAAFAVALLLCMIPGAAWAADGTIAGTVTEASTGLPLADVTIGLVGIDPETQNVGLETRTGADGTYQVAAPAGGYYVYFFRLFFGGTYIFYDGKSSQELADRVEVVAGQTTANIDAQFPHVPAGYLSGTVTDTRTGLPVPDAGINIYKWDSAEGYPGFGAGSASTGAFSIQLPVGTYRLSVWQGGYFSQVYDGHVAFTDADPVTVADGETTSIAIKMVPIAGSLRGVTKDVDGVIVPGVVVDLIDIATGEVVGTTLSGADGSYLFDPLYGRTGLYVAVRFTDPGHVYPAQYYVRYRGGSLDLAGATPLYAGPGAFNLTADARLFVGTATIEGTVTNEDGVPVAACMACAFDRRTYSEIARAPTDTAGHYSITDIPVALATICGLKFEPTNSFDSEFWDDKPYGDQADTIALAAGQMVTIDEQLATRCTIDGIVSDLWGPVSGVTVTLYDIDGDEIGQASTYTTGGFHFYYLPVGSYRLGFHDGSLRHVDEFYADATALETAAEIQVTPGQPNASVAVALTPKTISGTVRGPSGPLVRISVRLYEAGAPIRDTSTDAAGHYDLGGVSPGSYRIGFVDPSGDYAPEFYDNAPSLAAAAAIDITDTAPYAFADAELAANVRITGVVEPDSEFAPLPPWPEITVVLHRPDGSVVDTVVTDGEYAFDSLEPGDYMLEFTDPTGSYIGEYYHDAPGYLLTAALVHVDATHSHESASARLAPATRPAGALADGALEEVAKITGPGNGAGLGNSLALSDDTLVIGACWQMLPGAVTRPGLVYVHGRRHGVWAREAILSPPGPYDYQSFGRSVAVEGERIVVGSFLDDGRGRQPGAVYVFARDGALWRLEDTLVPSGTDASAKKGFGAAVSLSGDTILVGAPYASIGGEAEAGAAYIFVKTTDGWRQEKRLTAPSVSDDDFFGRSVALEGDRAVVGADMDDTAAGVNAGSAFVYERVAGAWSRKATIQADDASTGGMFGTSVALSGDTVLVGAPGQDYDAGVVYAFVRSDGGWPQQAALRAADGQPNDEFGRSLSLDGDAAVIGSPASDQPDGDAHGVAYRFTRLGVAWYQEARLTAAEDQKGPGVGTAVAVRGRTVAISVPSDRRDPELAIEGSVRLFEPYYAPVDLPFTVPAAEGLLANDIGLPGEPVQATLVDQTGADVGLTGTTTHGTVALTSDGGFTYTPAFGFAGTDTFFYAASSGTWRSEPALATLNVRDLTAPSVSPESVPKSWVNTAVTVTLSTGDAADVAAVDYRRHAPVDWNAYSGPFVVSRQGISRWDIRARDVFGNADVGRFALKIDTKRPTPQAPTAASVYRGGTATLRYKIVDARPGSPTATVTIVVKNSRNSEKWRVVLRGKKVNTSLAYSFRCNLPRGLYRFTVMARDTAGNAQSRTASNRLTVK